MKLSIRRWILDLGPKLPMRRRPAPSAPGEVLVRSVLPEFRLLP
jgi:hypothetical protein